MTEEYENDNLDHSNKIRSMNLKLTMKQTFEAEVLIDMK